MKVRNVIRALETMPHDAELELTRVLAVTQLSGEVVEIRLDFPIIGLAHSNDDVLLVVEHVSQLAVFGKILRFGERMPDNAV